VGDRRVWSGTAGHLAGRARLITYDRPGFGDSPAATGPHGDVADLLRLLDETVGAEAVWLVGASRGGGIALAAALTAPDRVRGLVVLSPAVAGAPPVDRLDPATERLADLLDDAEAAGDLDEQNRLETWLWLDGPAGPEGRVAGAPRELLLAMNRAILAADPEAEVVDDGVDVWARAGELTVPVTVAWGELDLPHLVERSRRLAERIPGAAAVPLPGRAHLPFLEDGALVAELVAGATGLPEVGAR
jgi:pimeloyl-ACP methyl ester carboxylesterase